MQDSDTTDQPGLSFAFGSLGFVISTILVTALMVAVA
jgi:hypothetical protein